MNKKSQSKKCCSVNRKMISDEKLKTVDHSTFEAATNEKKVFYDKGMVYLPGGDFLKGTEDKEGFKDDKEGPVQLTSVKPFYIDKAVVSNEEFKEFVEETGYVTDAEKYGWSFVFYKFLSKIQMKASIQLQPAPWWFAVKNAYWYQPEGENSDILDRLHHPVVHVSWNDALAFCKWIGKRLPTEEEWEYAARGGLEQKKYPWGDQLHPNGEHHCNIWQGDFPKANTLEDGYLGTAPVDSFPPNGYGLYNISGNVWEWCLNSFENTASQNDLKAIRGGSYLCHHSYCNRYRVAARSSNTLDSSTGNMGFRCARDAE